MQIIQPDGLQPWKKNVLVQGLCRSENSLDEKAVYIAVETINGIENYLGKLLVIINAESNYSGFHTGQLNIRNLLTITLLL